MTNVERVQNIYAAFGRGDIPAILETLAPDVDWEYDTDPNPIPWLQPRRGRENVMQFFIALGAIDIKSFEPKQYFADGDTVIGLCAIDFVIKANGARVVENHEVHIWHFNERGLVVRFRHLIDTLKVARALGIAP